MIEPSSASQKVRSLNLGPGALILLSPCSHTYLPGQGTFYGAVDWEGWRGGGAGGGGRPHVACQV